MKLAAAAILLILCALLPLVLAGYRGRTRWFLNTYFLTFAILPFYADLTFTLFFEDYQLIKGITRGLDLHVADFILLSLAIDLLVDPNRRTRAIPAGSWTYGILIVGLGVSIFDALDRNLVAFELAKLLKGALVFWVFANLARTRESFYWVVDGIVLVVGLLIAHVFFFWLNGDWYHSRLGHAPHKNVWALFLNTFGPVVIGLSFFRFRGVFYRFSFLAAVLGLGVLQKMSDSRGGQALYAYSVLLTAALSLVFLRMALNRTQFILLALCLTGALAIFWGDLEDRWTQGLVDPDPFLTGSREVLSERRHMATVSRDVFRQYPVNGIGLANYTLYWFEQGDSQTMVHQLYLLTAAEAGAIGVVALVVFLGYWIVIGFRLLYLPLPAPVMAVVVGLPAAFTVPVLHCLIEYNLRNYICYIAYGIMTGIATGIRDLRTDPSNAPPLPSVNVNVGSRIHEPE